MGIFSKIKDVFKKVVRKVGGVIKKVTSPIRKVLRKVLKPFGKLFGKLGWVGTIALGIIFPGFGAMLGGWMQGLTKLVMAPFQWLGQAIAPNFTNFLGKVVSGIKTAGKNVFSSITETFKHGLNKIGQAFGYGDPGKLGWVKGEGLVAGGVEGGAATITESFNNFVTQTRDKFLGTPPGVGKSEYLKAAPTFEETLEGMEDFKYSTPGMDDFMKQQGFTPLGDPSYDWSKFIDPAPTPDWMKGSLSPDASLMMPDLDTTLTGEAGWKPGSFLSRVQGLKERMQARTIFGWEKGAVDADGNPLIVKNDDGELVQKQEPVLGTWGEAGDASGTVMKGIDVYNKYLADIPMAEEPWENQNLTYANALLDSTNNFAPMDGLAFSSVPTSSSDSFNTVAGNYLTGFGYAPPSAQTDIFNFAMNMPGYGYTFQDHLQGQMNNFVPADDSVYS